MYRWQVACLRGRQVRPRNLSSAWGPPHGTGKYRHMKINGQYRELALTDGLAWPDYNSAREEAGFLCRARGSLFSLLGVTGYSTGESLRDTNVLIDAFRRGRKLYRELFGSDVSDPNVSTAPISYGHANVLGCPLIFPDDPNGDVGVEHAFQDMPLEGVIDAIRKSDPSSWPDAGEMPFQGYLLDSGYPYM